MNNPSRESLFEGIHTSYDSQLALLFVMATRPTKFDKVIKAHKGRVFFSIGTDKRILAVHVISPKLGLSEAELRDGIRYREIFNQNP